jgi:hypothetical protein
LVISALNSALSMITPKYSRREEMIDTLSWYCMKAKEDGVIDARPGAATIIQRAGGPLNLNPHFHCLVLDGVSARPDPRRPPLFHATAVPTDQDISDTVLTVRVKTLCLLQRRGLAPTEHAGGSCRSTG